MRPPPAARPVMAMCVATASVRRLTAATPCADAGCLCESADQVYHKLCKKNEKCVVGHTVEVTAANGKAGALLVKLL